MPNSTAIALIIASFFPTFFCFYYVVNLANTWARRSLSAS